MPDRRMPPEPAAAGFVPALVTNLRRGYGAGPFRADLVAGLTVAIVALPLSMAIAIASGGTPAMGLVTAIVGGFVISALGGSRYQIGGPAGAFIVLVGTTVAVHGIDGMILATFLSGLMLAALGFLRLGSYIKFVPHPVTVGFTAGIAVIIFASQIKELLGLTLGGPEPGPILQKLPVLIAALPTLQPTTLILAAATVALILGLRRWTPRLPGLLLAVAATTATAWALALPVATVGSVFGALPRGLPMPALPEFSLAQVMEVMPAAVAFTLLGAIESLLSAVVADSMSGERHDPNMELAAQGAGNLAVALFGGLPVTGTIARTATNVRAGAHGPVSGMLHAGFLLAFMLLAAPLAAFIPLAALAGVLAVVAWNMIERDAIVALFRSGRGEATVLSVTFLLTVFRDLTEAILVGVALGALLFIRRMSLATEIERQTSFVPSTRLPDSDTSGSGDASVAVCRIRGAFFFGAAASVSVVLERIADTHRGLVIDLSGVPFVDSSAVATLEGIVHKAKRNGVKVMLTGTDHAMRVQLFAQGLKPPAVSYETTAEAGARKLHHMLGTG